MRAVSALLGALLWWCCAGGAAAFENAPAVRAGMLRASDLILNLDLDQAARACDRLAVERNGEAAGLFCHGLVTLTRADQVDDPAPDRDRFLEQARDALRAAESLDRTQPADAEVKLLLGLIQGSQALAEAARKEYLAAWQDLRGAHQRFSEALALDPELVDAAYGMGLYNYALGHLPALLKPLVSVVLPSGDPGRGLGEIERVADRGTYLKMTARVALLQLYAGQEEKYAEAFRLGQELVRRYPGNPELYFATAHAASELGRFADALEIGRAVGRNLAEGRPHFTADLTARYYQLMGKIAMDQGDAAGALAFFRRALEAVTPVRLRWVTAWAWTRSGMVYDLLGEREEATRHYREALAVKSEGAAQERARQYLETPYRGRSRPRS